MQIPEPHIIAEGPEGLQNVLNDLMDKCTADTVFAQQEHCILYQLGNQKSLIKVDTTNKPFKFLYNDLMGRPATTVIKETIGRFLWEKCGEKELYQDK
jgi:hypothetical protein